MKQHLNEIKRMQQLAGIRPLIETETPDWITPEEFQTIGRSNYTNQILKLAKKAIEVGKKVTVNGQPIEKIVPAAGAFFPVGSTTSIRINNIENPLQDIIINGISAEDLLQHSEVKPPVDTRTPEEIAAAQKAWNDRYGPGGGYDTPFGRYTGD